MKKTSRNRLAGLLLCLIIPVTAFSQSIEPLAFIFPELVATGGTHAARANGVMALFENPAGFVDDNQELSISALNFNLSGPVLSMVDMVVAAVTVADPFGQIISGIPGLLDASGRLYAAIDLTGPIAFSYVGKGLGFGLYNRTYFNLNVASPFAATFALREELVLMGGYAYRFDLANKQSLDMGIMPKGFLRTELSDTTTLLGLVTVLGDTASLLSSVPFTITAGAGFDLGLRWNYDDMVGLGLVCRDAFSPASIRTYPGLANYLVDATSAVPKAGLIPADLSIGTFFKPSIELLTRLGTDVVFLIDYHDVFNLFAPIPRNPILNAGAGVEVQIMEILTIQAAVKDALPVLGLSVDLTVMNISFAMYGRELGLDPGQRPVYNILLALDFVY